eukprot:SAG31_NODE_2417_length_5729_cov_2.939432_4_plen_146_part_00
MSAWAEAAQADVPALDVRCKDARRVLLLFDGGGAAAAYDAEHAAATSRHVLQKLQALVSEQTDGRPGLGRTRFSYRYGNQPSTELDGWSFYDAVAEYQRQGMREGGDHPWAVHRGQDWQSLSPTYPPVVVVPRSATDDMLRRACR